MHLLNLDTTNNKLQQARTQINYRSASIEIRISINSRLSHVTVSPPRKKVSILEIANWPANKRHELYISEDVYIVPASI